MSFAESIINANQLNEAVKGKKIVNVIANQNPHKFVWFALEPSFAFCPFEQSNEFAKEYGAYMVGNAIKGVEVISGGTYMYIGDRVLTVGVKTLYHEANAPRSKKHQLLLELEDGSALSFCSSLGGALFLYKAYDKKEENEEANGFPSFLSERFSLEFFLNLTRGIKLGKTKTVKDLLATRNHIPGIDNGILHEILWEAQVHPKTLIINLQEEDYIRIYDSIKKVFSAVISGGGKDTDKDLHGNYGTYITHASKKTLDKPCVRCGVPIEKDIFLGGAIYYCPGCQPKKN